MSAAPRPWMLPRWCPCLVGALVLLVITSGCQQMVCEETYPMWRKLLQGLAVPMLLATAIAAGIFAAANALLRNRSGVPVLAAFVMSLVCTVPFVMDAVEASSELMFVAWILAVLGATLMGLPPRVWAPAGWLRRIGALMLLPVLMISMLVCTVGAGLLVQSAGQTNCRPK